MSDDSKKNKPFSSPSSRLSDLGREEGLKRQVEEILADRENQSINEIKTHIDDAMQIVLETIEQRFPIVGEEPKDKKLEFYVGLGIGLSMLVGFIAGLLMRGIL